MAEADESARESNLRGTLFRSNTVATKLLTACARAAASDYLVSILGDTIANAVARGLSYEVDPSRLGPADTLEKNQELLRELCEKLFEQITQGVVGAPKELRDICRAVRAGIQQHHGNVLAARMTGSFLFLRFLCPAIVMPLESGLLPPGSKLPSEGRRALLLCSKILQQLANGLVFATKEPYMLPYNSFVTKNATALAAYVEAMCLETVPDAPAVIVSNPLPEIMNLAGEPWQTLGDAVDDAILFGLSDSHLRLQAQKLKDALAELDDGQPDPLIATITVQGNSAANADGDFWAMVLIFAATPASKVDDLIGALVLLFRHEQQAPALLKWVIERELSGQPVKCGKDAHPFAVAAGQQATVANASSGAISATIVPGTTSDVVLEGIMWKTSHKVNQKPGKAMKKQRYFVLKNTGHLCYWKGTQAGTGEPAARIDVCECCVETNTPDMQHNCYFELVDRNRCLRLYTSSQPEKERWVRGLLDTRLEALKRRAAIDAGSNSYKGPQRKSYGILPGVQKQPNQNTPRFSDILNKEDGKSLGVNTRLASLDLDTDMDEYADLRHSDDDEDGSGTGGGTGGADIDGDDEYAKIESSDSEDEGGAPKNGVAIARAVGKKKSTGASGSGAGASAAAAAAAAAAAPRRREPEWRMPASVGDLELASERDERLCGGCSRPIKKSEDALQAMDREWHLDHFVCETCYVPLDGEFFIVKDRPYCVADHDRLFVPKCAGCDKPLGGQVMSALDRQWHRGCFCCTTCGGALIEFLHANGKPYCATGNCVQQNEHSNGTCAKCGQDIIGEYLETLDKTWHRECFACEMCGVSLMDGHFFNFEGKQHCMVCFNRAAGNECHSCQMVITEGKVVTAGVHKFHMHCFKCDYPGCGLDLVSTTYYPVGTKYFCETHGPEVAKVMLEKGINPQPT